MVIKRNGTRNGDTWPYRSAAKTDKTLATYPQAVDKLLRAESYLTRIDVSFGINDFKSATLPLPNT